MVVEQYGEHPAVEGLFLPVFIYLVYDLLKSAEHKVFGVPLVPAKAKSCRIEARSVLFNERFCTSFGIFRDDLPHWHLL